MRFEWDARKAKANLRKHGVSFEEARTVFEDRDARMEFDSAHSDEEDRFLLLGFSGSDRPLIVSYCYKDGDLIRIISARKAAPRDQLAYRKR